MGSGTFMPVKRAGKLIKPHENGVIIPEPDFFPFLSEVHMGNKTKHNSEQQYLETKREVYDWCKRCVAE